MSSVTGPFSYLLFDRLLVSDVELALLRPYPIGVTEIKPALSLAMSSIPVTPHGEVVLDTPGDPTRILWDGVRTYFHFNSTHFVAVVEEDGLTISLHPHADKPRSAQEIDREKLGDRLVTTVLSRLPIMWGTPSVHGATLSWAEGSVVLVGTSGVGKSTVSQHLVRDHGATLHDDDTALIEWESGQLEPIPMGGAPRLRRDAAQNLEIGGRTLPGFSGGKVALAQEPPLSLPVVPPVRVVCEIVSLSEGASEHTITPAPKLDIVEPVCAIPEAWKHVFTTNLSTDQTRLRFDLSHKMASVPYARISYLRGAHQPHQVSDAIRNYFASQ